MHAASLAPLLLQSSLFAQTLSILVTEGDVVPGVGTITRVDGMAIAGDGSIYIEVDTDNPDTDTDSVLLRNGVLYLREGQALNAPAGAELGSFDGMAPGFRGGPPSLNLFLDGAVTTNDNSGVFLGDKLVIREGDLSTAPGFAAGTVFRGFFDVERPGDLGGWLVVATLDDPSIATSLDQALIVLSVNTAGVLQSERIVVKEGDLLPGQTGVVSSFETGAEESAINASGQVIYSVDVNSATNADRSVYLDQTLLMREGSPSPAAGRNWGSLTSVEVDLALGGDWVAKANLDSTDPATDDVIVKNGAIFMRAGDSLPAIGSFTFTDFGGSAGVWITRGGDVVWFGDWDDPDTSRDEGLFINDQLVLQEGVTTVNGQTIVDLSDITEQIFVSNDGGFILIEGEVNQGGVDRDVVIRIDTHLGVNYCMANPNSTGDISVIRVAGSLAVADNNVILQASNIPAYQFGIFITSQTQGFTPNPNGSQGNVCLGSSIGRYMLPSEIVSASPGGFAQLKVDLNSHPTPGGRAVVQAGQTWSFQMWHRDIVGATATSNFTDGVSVTFQ